jgi:hypothetical protein
MDEQQFLTKLKQLTTSPRITPKQAYRYGFDCGKNGANTTNCHFAIFSVPENTREWERGNKNGIKAKKRRKAQPH